MWMAQRGGKTAPEGGTAVTGPVPIPGHPAGVYLEGERRGVAIYAPGGYHWVPGLGADVLVLKAGEGGERPCAVGVPTGGAGEELAPGEVLITGGKCSIRLRLDRRIEVTGTLLVNGTQVGPGPKVEGDE